jgi:hypothetical protein
MLSLFRNRKKQKATKYHDEVQDQFLKSILHTCLIWQSRWAFWMQRKAEKLSGKGKLIMLLIFVLFSGSYTIYLIGESFSGNPKPSFSITSIKRPAHVQENGDESKHTNTVISQSEYERIHQFRQYMDSLTSSPTGKVLHDSIVAHRPGLMDSIQIIENMYQSQIKK